MMRLRFRRVLNSSLLATFSVLFCVIGINQIALAQGATKSGPGQNTETDADHVEQRSKWFLRGREVPGKSSAELRHRAYQTKMQSRATRLACASNAKESSKAQVSSGGWIPLGPVPLASDGTGSGLQDYHQVSGRSTAVAIDPADGTGNTVFVGGAQGGVWKSTNAASVALSVTWSGLTDDQATLSVGSIAIEPGNSDPAKSVVLVGTGEADSSADSYFGLGILRSADGGNTWTLIPSANGGAYSFAGLGGTRMAFSTASGQTNTVVAAMAASAEGQVDGALTGNSYRGLYTSTDAGLTWSYDALFSGGAAEATSATSVVYNATAGLFFAALRYHGFYSSPDGLNWTRLTNQPGASGTLSTAECPQNYVTTCPIYRGEITVVPGRNEMYVWFVSLDSSGNPIDQGIWQSGNGGASWAPISDSGIVNCGDFDGCGVQQGLYNLALLAVPNGGTATDLYAGAVNLYKCSISAINPACSNVPFLNLTHTYGCDPFGAPAHVHPDQHAMAYVIPTSSGADLMYFANDGGVYRTLNGFTGLTTGSCSETNQFDDLNQNLGSMTQFVSFSQHPANVGVILGGTQDNGSPATETATTNLGWGNVLTGDGGYNAIDANTDNWFASNPDTGSGGLNIQECSSGISCNDSLFGVVISSADLGGDDGAFYFPYILDPQSTSSLLVGTCRVWRGPRTGGAFSALSLNFQTFGTGTCAGTEENVIRALAAGGATDENGSQVIYATTDSLGPNSFSTPPGGNIWVTTNASAVEGVSSTFNNVTLNGPGGSSINPNQFPISSVAIDASDTTGHTAYITVMGFTGGPGHVWLTTNAGHSWTDFSGSGASALPDSPANAVVVDPSSHVVYVGTDVGAFQSSTASAAWIEVGPIPSPTSAGYLPNAAVTALAIFNAGGQKLLRASTYGRGVWQYNLLAVPDFAIAVSNTPITIFAGQPAIFNGTLTSLNNYNNQVALSCAAGSSGPLPSPCVASPGTLTPTQAGASFSVAAGPTGVADYNFNVQGLGFDPNGTTHTAALTLHVVNWSMTNASPSSVTVPRGATSPPVSFEVSAQGSFNQSVTLSCNIGQIVFGASCTFSPSATFNLTTGSPASVTATVTMPYGAPLSPPNLTVTIQASTAGAPTLLTSTFGVDVIPNPTFVLSEATAFPNVKAGSTGSTGPITISSQDGFAGTVGLQCSSSYGASSCAISPATVNVSLPPAPPATAVLTINGTSFSAGAYQLSVLGTSSSLSNSLAVPFSVGDYAIGGTQTFAAIVGTSAMGSLSFTSLDSYSGQISVTCDASTLPGAQCTLSPSGPITLRSGAVSPVSVTINVPSTAAARSYTVNINTQDATGEPVHSWTMDLNVQDFNFGPVTPPSQIIGAGQTASYNLTVTPVGVSFPNAINFSCSGAPANAICGFSPASVVPGSGSASVGMTITTTTTSAPGKYSVAIMGTSGSLSHSTSVALSIGNTFQLAVTQPFSSSADAGSQQTAKISLTPNYSGSASVTCDATGLPGTQCTLSPANPIPISGSAIILTALINIPANAAPGTYNVMVHAQDAGAGGTPSGALTLPFTVIQDFAVGSLTPPTQTINAGQSASYNLSVLPVGASFSNAVNLSCSGAPAVSLCSFTPNPVTPGNNSAAVVMSVSTTSTSAAAVGNPLVYAMWLALPALVLFRKRPKMKFPTLMLGLLMLALLLPSCGGGGKNGGGGGGQQQGTQPGTYTITVTGTSGSLSHSATPTVTLIIN